MSDLEQDVAQFSQLLFAIVADVEKRLATHYARHHLTPPQFYVLKTLIEHGGRCRIGEIATDQHLTNATMTGLVKRLEAMTPPLVKRERNKDDGRSVDVILSDDGRARYMAVQTGLIAQARAILEILPADEREQAITKVTMYFHMLTQMFPVE